MTTARTQARDDTEVVAVGGRRIRMRVQGSGDPLLLLNGLTRPLESWGPFTEAIRGRTIISFDVPGVGGSPTPLVPWSIPMLARLATSVLDEARVATADVIGFSHGGAIAQQLAIQSPDRVRRLVLVSTSCGVGATPGDRDATGFRRTPTAESTWPPPDAMGTLWLFLAISTWSSIPFLGALRAPTLVVCGDHDRVVPPANGRLLARRIPGAELVLLPAGHDLQKSGPARALAAAADTFLSCHQPHTR